MHLSWVGVSKALVMHGQQACLSLSRGGRIPVMVTDAGYALPANRQSFCPLSWDSALAKKDYLLPKKEEIVFFCFIRNLRFAHLPLTEVGVFAQKEN